MFLDTLAEACERTGFEIQGSRANISRAVQAYRQPTDRARKTFKNKVTKCSL